MAANTKPHPDSAGSSEMPVHNNGHREWTGRRWMGIRYCPYQSKYQPKQLLALSPDLREWVPEGHLAHQVNERGMDSTAWPNGYGTRAQKRIPKPPFQRVTYGEIVSRSTRYKYNPVNALTGFKSCRTIPGK